MFFPFVCFEFACFSVCLLFTYLVLWKNNRFLRPWLVSKKKQCTPSPLLPCVAVCMEGECLNGGRCNNGKCACEGGYTGEWCQKAPGVCLCVLPTLSSPYCHFIVGLVPPSSVIGDLFPGCLPLLGPGLFCPMKFNSPLIAC